MDIRGDLVMIEPNRARRSLRLPMIAAILAGLLMTFTSATAEQDTAVEIRDIETGEGPAIAKHDTAILHYTGKLARDGTTFDSSRDSGAPFALTLGTEQVVPGFEQGVVGMRAGGRRIITIPPELAYGERGAGNIIPPDATLRFEVEILEVDPAPFTGLDNDGLAEKIREDVTIVDIRRPDEWAETGVVEGSHRLTAFDASGELVSDFGTRFTELTDPDEEVVLICRVGNRTGALARALAEGLGYANLYEVTDGITGWLADDRPVRQDCPDITETVRC